MRILVTGASGWLGRHLVPLLRREGHAVVGLDVVAGPCTDVIGSFEDRALVAATLSESAIEAIVHSGALHKPDVARCPRSAFVSVNVQGTLNLLEEAVAQGVGRFVLTSTTSLMITAGLHDGTDGAREAAWIDESLARLTPRNIYGVTKMSAEHLCRLFHELYGLPVVILRTSRFFPEADDRADEIPHSDENTKANEYLFRRLAPEDAAAAHLAALEKAPEIGFDTFIVSAMPPFRRADCAELITDAPAVVARYFPDYPAIYAALGWTMFDRIDRVYDPGHAARRLGFVCHTGFREILDRLAAEEG